MPTARIRNYVKKNPNTIEGWRDKVLKKHIVRVLTEVHGAAYEEVSSEDFSISNITGHGGQDKICRDILYDHYELASECETQASGTYGTYKTRTVVVYETEFYEMTKGRGVKPVFPTVDVDKVNEDDVYTLIKKMSLDNLIYIYENQDEFCFLPKTYARYYGNGSNRCEGLGVFFKSQKDDADNMSFRNALDKYYGDKLNVIGPLVCDKKLPDLIKKEGEYGESYAPDSTEFGDYHGTLFPEDISHLKTEHINKLLSNVQYGMDTLLKTQQQLLELQGSIKEAGGDDAFRDKYYEKMMENFYRNIPLFINVKDADLKALAKRASKKQFK